MVKLKKSGFVLILILFIIVITACQKGTPTQDASLQITQVANTVMAQITQMAALTPSATPTPLPTATPTEIPPTPTLDETVVFNTPVPTAGPTSADSTVDNATWVSDITYPDGAIVKPGTTFVKTWRIKNTGKTTWSTAYRLVYLDGLQGANGILNVHLPKAVEPGSTVDVSVTFTAPSGSGTAYTKIYSYWRLYNSDLKPFGEQMSLRFFLGNP
jgi:hypothetical protein